MSVLCFTLVSQLYLNPACLAVRKTHQNSMPIVTKAPGRAVATEELTQR